MSEGVQFFKHNKFNCLLADWQKWQEPPFSFSRKKCLQVIVVEGDKFREDFKSILFSTFTSSSASWHWKKDLYEAMLD